jgi:tetratricopeptide (TPR) repeat protein
MTTISGVHFWLPPLDAQPGPATRISRTRAANIVSMAMGFETRSRIDVKRPRPRRRAWAKVAFLSAAAFVLPVTVVAGAVRFVAARRPMPAALLAAAPPALTLADPKPAPRAVEAPVVAAPVEVAAPTELVATIETPRASETRTKPIAAPRPAVEASPRDMLQQANDLRAQRQWLAATQIYEKTLRTFPGRAEAYSATVAAGVLRLDQLGDPKGALALFSSAVRARPRGPLAEEARWGAIQSYRALGDRGSEMAALQEFVTLHPQSLLAWRALARLRELRGEPASP